MEGRKEERKEGKEEGRKERKHEGKNEQKKGGRDRGKERQMNIFLVFIYSLEILNFKDT
jgi:hypothetical protein